MDILNGGIQMRPFGAARLLEHRSRQAIVLLDSGISLDEVALRLNCHATSVMRWRDARRAGRDAGLKPKPTPGRPAKLTDKQHDRLVRLLPKGAMAHGYRTALWTTARIADLIEEKFAVRYHRNHIGRLLSSLGWT